MYPVSKVLDRRTDLQDRVQYLVRWKGYGTKHDSWVDEKDVNNTVRLAYSNKNQGIPGILQTLEVMISAKLNMRRCPTKRSIQRRASVTIPMDYETFKDLFGSLPSAPRDLNRRVRAKFSVPPSELDTLFSQWWSSNTFKTPTKCIIQPNVPVHLAFIGGNKVFYDHSACPRCQGQDITKCTPVRRTVMSATFLKLTFHRQRSKNEERDEEMQVLTWAKDKGSFKTKSRKKKKD